MSNVKTAGTREILSAMLSDHVGDDAAAIKADAVGYINDNTGVDLSQHDVNLVQNDAATMNVALPYYSGLESRVTAIDEEELLGVAGGSDAAAMAYGAYRAATDYLQKVGADPNEPTYQFFTAQRDQMREYAGDSPVPTAGK